MAGVHRWQFTPEELQNTPSRKAGIDADKELNYRQQCANLIQDMGQRLNVTQLCISTAIVYMHRFYVFHSFTRFHRNPMASTCLFLAAKVEEQPRKLEHVITWYHMCVNRDQGPLDVKSENYLEMAQELVSNENILLQTLGFDISVEHPHQNVVKTCTLVKASKDLAQTSYILATNSLHLTTMCLHIRHTVVACVCIHLACKWSNYQIPCSSEGKQWFEYVDKDTTIAELEVLTNDFLTILDNCPSKLKKKILTWKSGNNKTDLSDEMANALSKSEEQSTPTERRRMPPASAAAGSAAAAAQKDFQRSSAGHPSHAGGSGLRRVQTEPAIAQIEQKRSKKPSHPPPTHGHHRDIPGYHGKPPPQQQHSVPPHHKHPYSGSTAGKPTHPPPSSKSRHSGHPLHPSASSSSATRHQPDAARANIFEQMQIEQGGEPTTSAGGVGVVPTSLEGHSGVVSRKSLPPQQQQQHPQHRVHGSHQQKTPHGPNQRPPHSAVSPAVLATSSSQKRNHTEETRNRDSLTAGPGGEPVGLSSKEHSLKMLAAARQQDKQGKQAWRLEEGEICGTPSGLAAPVSVSVQERQEREMQEKLQNEMRKQKERSQKLEKERKERQLQKALKSPGDLKSPGELKSPQLASPPIGGGGGTGRSKNDSTSSKSDSDTGSKHTPTKEERLRLLKEHQNQVMQDDRKRLRRMSEELGDPKIEKKTVVMLDNYFTSPEVPGSSSQETSPRGGAGKMDKNHAAGLQSSGGEKGNVPTPSRTISLEKYRERKPPAAPQATPTGGQSSSSDYQLINPDKPSLAMEHLASIKLQGLKPLSEILKSSDMVKKEEEDLTATNNPTIAPVRIKLEAPSPKKGKSEKLQRQDSSGRLAAGKSAHTSSDPPSLTKHAADQMLTAKSDIKLEFDPTTKVQHRSTSQQKLLLSREPSAEMLQHRSSGGSKDHPLTTSSSSSVSVVKQEVFDSPKREKNIPSLKIKLGGKPVVTMSPGTSEHKELSPGDPVVTRKEHHHHGHKEHGHRHHEKKPHKHKHRDRSKHRGEAASAVVVLAEPIPTVTPSSRQAGGGSGKSDSETMSGEKLKLKFNLKQLGMSSSESGAAVSSESPFKIDNPNRSLTGTPELVDAAGVSATTPGASQAGGTPGSGGGSANSSSSAAVKLVLQKDRSGQYSSGQKAKHSTNNSSSRHHSDKSSRKRVHSPADQQRKGGGGVLVSEASAPVVPMKIPRSDSSASLGGYELNGSRSNSPSQMELMQQQARKVEKLIEKQKKNIKKTLEQQGGSGNTPTGLTNSPRVHPQAYPP